MEIVKLSASSRSEQGKGPSRRLRNAGKIPAVAYGAKLAATNIAVSPKELGVVLASAHGRNTVVELDVDGGSRITAMVREYAHHPVSRAILHADFYQVDLAQPVDVDVPLKLVGKAKGIVAGGIMSQVYRELPVRCLPERIPALIELDVTELGLNESMKASQLVLPDGVSARLPAEQTVAGCNAPEKREEEPGPEAAKVATAAAPGAAPAAAPAKAADKKGDKKKK